MSITKTNDAMAKFYKYKDRYIIDSESLFYVEEHPESVRAHDVAGYYGKCSKNSVQELFKVSNILFDEDINYVFYIFGYKISPIIYLNSNKEIIKELESKFIYKCVINDINYDNRYKAYAWAKETLGAPFFNRVRKLSNLDAEWYSIDHNIYIFNNEQTCKWMQMVWA